MFGIHQAFSAQLWKSLIGGVICFFVGAAVFGLGVSGHGGGGRISVGGVSTRLAEDSALGTAVPVVFGLIFLLVSLAIFFFSIRYLQQASEVLLGTQPLPMALTLYVELEEQRSSSSPRGRRQYHRVLHGLLAREAGKSTLADIRLNWPGWGQRVNVPLDTPVPAQVYTMRSGKSPVVIRVNNMILLSTGAEDLGLHQATTEQPFDKNDPLAKYR